MTTLDEEKAARAFRWIVGLLQSKEVPFQVVGGLAARAYGATRPLADIDLYVPGSRLPDFLPDVEAYVTFGPEPYVGPHWDLTWMALDYGGQKIEIGDGERVRIFDCRAEQWVDATVDFDTFETMSLFGMDVPVMPKDRLMAYKRRLDRLVDRQDLAALASNSTTP